MCFVKASVIGFLSYICILKKLYFYEKGFQINENINKNLILEIKICGLNLNKNLQ